MKDSSSPESWTRRSTRSARRASVPPTRLALRLADFGARRNLVLGYRFAASAGRVRHPPLIRIGSIARPRVLSRSSAVSIRAMRRSISSRSCGPGSCWSRSTRSCLRDNSLATVVMGTLPPGGHRRRADPSRACTRNHALSFKCSRCPLIPQQGHRQQTSLKVADRRGAAERFADCQVFPMPFHKGDPDWPQLRRPLPRSWDHFFT